MGIIDSRHKN